MKPFTKNKIILFLSIFLLANNTFAENNINNIYINILEDKLENISLYEEQLKNSYNYHNNSLNHNLTELETEESELSELSEVYYSDKFIDLKNDLKKGNKDNRILIIKNNNTYFFEENEINNIFDKKFEDFIKSWQESIGFYPTGILDKNTWYSLYNQNYEWQIKAISKSKEELEKLIIKSQEQQEQYFINVNIPNMTLYLYDKNNLSYPILTSKVIIGKINSKTPLEDIKLIGIKYNPDWTPTPNMIRKEVKNGNIKKTWIDKNKLIIKDKQGNILDKDNLENLNINNIGRIYQKPGNNNALGLIKFETDSKQNIYLHDTNHREYFNYNSRVISSGCIRVQNYKELASFIENINIEEIDKKINTKKTFINKTQIIPIYFSYNLINFIDYKQDSEIIIFSPDIYNYL